MNQIDNIDMASESTEEIVEQLVLDGMPEPTEPPKPTMTLDGIIETLIQALGWTETTSLTLYQLSKLVNGTLVALDAKKMNKDGVLVDYRVTSQMMYGYGSNKMVVKGRSITGANPSITTAEAAAFTKRFAAKFVK